MTVKSLQAADHIPKDIRAGPSQGPARPGRLTAVPPLDRLTATPLRDHRIVPWSTVSARIGCTPLLKIRLRIHRRWRDVWLKLEQFNRGGSIKDRTAYGLIEDLEERGLMHNADTIVESTSGNLGIGLTLVCKERGYRFIAVVDPVASEYSVQRMRDLGAQIEIVQRATSGQPLLASRLARVQELLQENPDIVWTNQYGSTANPRIHRHHTGVEILRQLGTCPEAIFIAVSTGGTLKGVAQYLHTFAPGCQIAAVDVVGSVVLGGAPGIRNIPGIGSSRISDFLQDKPYDLASYVSETEAIATCHALRLCTNIGLGGSSGAVIAAAARFLQRRQSTSPVVCLCPDGSDRYENSIYNLEWLRTRNINLEDSISLPFDDIDCN
jgi:N-(2-amino-2-carboxyethyl)-L-glutamate synthase